MTNLISSFHEVCFRCWDRKDGVLQILVYFCLYKNTYLFYEQVVSVLHESPSSHFVKVNFIKLAVHMLVYEDVVCSSGNVFSKRKSCVAGATGSSAKLK